MKRAKKPLLMILGVLICLVMLRLGVWQLDRAEQKQVLLDQVVVRSEMPTIDLLELIKNSEKGLASTNRFRLVTALGRYAPERSIYLDNKVVGSNVGYSVLTPFKLSIGDYWVLVDRGWLSVGATRTELPGFQTDKSLITIAGRLNTPTAQPPLWNDDYPVANGAVWQYLPLSKYAEQMKLKLLPLVLELAPVQGTESNPQLIRQWAKIDDQWVAKHHAYAFQWFAMAVVFFIACLILLFRSIKAHDSSTE